MARRPKEVCPICNKSHKANTKSHKITIPWKGVPLTYIEDYSICKNKKYFTEEQLSENWRRLIRAEKVRDKL